jgi:predicted transcriptional regulator YdeE
MEPQFVERDAFTVMGVQERFTPETEDFEGIWKRYMAHHKAIEALSDAQGWCGVCFGSEEAGAMDYLAGMAVPRGAACPEEGLVVREVPAGRYAAFACTVATIRETYEFIHHSWLGDSPYVLDDPRPCFEHYAPGTDSGESPVLIHVPVRERGDG